MDLKALIFDVDGTLADTERLHLEAFNYAFRAKGLGVNKWCWNDELYTRLLEVSGGKERIAKHASNINESLSDELIKELHAIKTQNYADCVAKGALKLRDGVEELIKEAYDKKYKIAIATTTTPDNISALLSYNLGSNWESFFDVIEDGHSAPIKKPHPQVYLQALERLGVDASQAIAFEDSINGIKATTQANIKTIITPTIYTKAHDFGNAFMVVDNLSDINIEKLKSF